jgi:hypothetical protein
MIRKLLVPAGAALSASMRRRGADVHRAGLSVAGLGAVSYSAFTVSVTLGWLAVGIACFLMEYLLTSDAGR